MTLQDYLKIFRHRWMVIAVCAAVAGIITWFITPASTDTTKKVGSYVAKATILVGSKDPERSVNMGRIPLYMTTGEIPTRAAKAVGFEGDPARLAAGLTVTPDNAAEAITVSATASDGGRAADVANAFADETVKFFSEKPRAGAEEATLSILEKASPIPVADTSGGFVVPPGRGPRTAIAAVLGILIGLALALLLDRLDSRLRSRGDIASALRMPIIAEIPRLKRSQRYRATIAVAEDPLSNYSDGYRAARTALVHTSGQVMPGDYTPRRSAVEQQRPGASGARLILVTSAHAAEGKTTSVANLAASFAETGQRVLVLDADLRSPDVHTVFDVPQGAGISDYLSNPSEDASLEAVVRPTSVNGVRIISAGTSLAHPASLASRMGHLLEEARGMADVVLVDSAPLLEASDVFDILPTVDTLLLVVRSGRLTAPAGNRVAELVGRFQVPVSGVIIVGAQTKRADAYGYGYGENRQSKQKARRGRKRQKQAQRRAASLPPAPAPPPAGPPQAGPPAAVPQYRSDPTPASTYEGIDLEEQLTRESRRTRRTSSSA